MTAHRPMTLLSWMVTAVALVVVLTGCETEKTSNEPRPAIAPAAGDGRTYDDE